MIPAEIETDMGAFIRELDSLGFRVDHARYDATSFGNYVVGLHGPNCALRIVRDRGQYIIYADIERLKRLGLWRAFDDSEEFCAGVRTYIRSMA